MHLKNFTEHAPSELTKHTPLELAEHAPSELTKHAPSELIKHAPSELTKHAPSEPYKIFAFRGHPASSQLNFLHYTYAVWSSFYGLNNIQTIFILYQSAKVQVLYKKKSLVIAGNA